MAILQFAIFIIIECTILFDRASDQHIGEKLTVIKDVDPMIIIL